MDIKHKVIFVEHGTNTRYCSEYEKSVANSCDKYRNIRNKRISRFAHTKDYNDLCGMVEYMSPDLNLRKSAIVSVHLYRRVRGKRIFDQYIDFTIMSIANFITNNGIESIEFSGDDIARCMCNGIDYISLLRKQIGMDININITTPYDKSPESWTLISKPSKEDIKRDNDFMKRVQIEEENEKERLERQRFRRNRRSKGINRTVNSSF